MHHVILQELPAPPLRILVAICGCSRGRLERGNNGAPKGLWIHRGRPATERGKRYQSEIPRQNADRQRKSLA